MKIQVLIRLKPGVLDVQGKAVEGGLKDLGATDISGVRIGRLVEMNVKALSFDAAKEHVEELCKKLLVNPIIEQYEIRQA